MTVAEAQSTIPQSVEYGDFQTPLELAEVVVALLRQQGVAPASVVEPTCGRGNFLFTALDGLQASVQKAVGVDISPAYIAACVACRNTRRDADKITLHHENFFTTDWLEILRPLPDPLLVIGNPPWVTNTAVETLGGTNLPQKTNFQNYRGLEAVMGKSNFDISEWMLLRTLDWLQGRSGTLAMLVKTTVARKILAHAWKNGLNLCRSSLYRINATQHFGAAVDACLFVCSFTPQASSYASSRDCAVYSSLSETDTPVATIGWRDGELIADLSRYAHWKHLCSTETSENRWRSGVKHDCAKVMEITHTEAKGFINGFGEPVDVEPTHLFPLLKTSEVAKGQTVATRVMLVPQRFVGENTALLRDTAPRTWAYLLKYAALLDKRASRIYQKRPRFSVFGVGTYTFAPWKVAISGFYKHLLFTAIGPQDEKPVVFDDASYFLPCTTREQAEKTALLLNSPIARAFFESFVFWDTKRPITVDLLRRLNLDLLACADTAMTETRRSPRGLPLSSK